MQLMKNFWNWLKLWIRQKFLRLWIRQKRFHVKSYWLKITVFETLTSSKVISRKYIKYQLSNYGVKETIWPKIPNNSSKSNLTLTSSTAFSALMSSYYHKIQWKMAFIFLQSGASIGLFTRKFFTSNSKY